MMSDETAREDAGRMVDDLLELYAIDALPADEMRAFEESLAVVDAIHRRRAVAEIRGTREAVARWAAEYEFAPRAEVRAGVLSSLDARVGSDPRPAATGSGAAPVVVDELAARRSRRRRIAVAMSSAAAALILVVGGVLIGRSTVTSDNPPPSIAQSDQMAQLQSVMSRPDAEVHRTQMTGMPGTVVVASSRSADTAVVLLEGAQQPPTERAYQLWLIGNAHSPRSAGLVTEVSAQAPVVITGLADSRTIGMTEEPEGGSPQPTGEVLAAVTI
ncbi:anti-sigma factor [Williamsia deligens]|uniref:Regulator of SigK n=1 Tax=Williamsia deligens TaxID=321325 RepID=A0ABW3G9U5_9NOCA|nr:anti-sigma factor [Williamsia deligens]MCP2193602.1 Anti-sigma-K factor RskA [Williamsia deligens]